MGDDSTVHCDSNEFFVAPSPAEPSAPASFIGKYRIVSRIGAGGMGVVYEAEQPDPKRAVALKVIRGGRFVDDHLIRLFQREADALARLRHPGIAPIYESGRTDDGQHFFTMELVHGVPLADYFRNRPPCATFGEELRLRLSIFSKIAAAVSYAHQRGVIHRDLKPANILITAGEGVPDLKILDFGLARITDTDIAATTSIIGVQGTLSYMSPEQARGMPDEVDFRTDIYSLGVILYELLTGNLPHNFAGKSVVAAMRMICEEPVPPPRRALDGSKIDGDLQTIVLKALEKDPERRYSSVAALNDDLERYLRNEPVLACPPSTLYHIRKLTSRHKVAVTFAGVLIVLLAAFAVVMTVQARRIAGERNHANQEAQASQRVTEFLTGLFSVSDPLGEAKGNKITARELLDQGSARIERELKNQPTIQARLMDTMGYVYQRLGLYDRATPLLENALSIRQHAVGNEHIEVADSLDHLGELAFYKGDLVAAEKYLRGALTMRRKLLGNEHLAVTESLNDLGKVLRTKETPQAMDEAERYYREALTTRRKVLGGDHSDIADSLNNLAMLLYANKGDYAAAEPLFREAVEMYRRTLGEEDVEVATTMNNLALLLRDKRNYDEAEQLFRKALAMDRKILGDSHPDVAVFVNNLANLLQRKGDYAGAESMYRQAIELSRKVFPPDHWEIASIKSLLGGCLIAEHRYREAEPLLLESYPIIKSNFGDSHNRTRVTLQRIVDLYDAWGKPQQAAPYAAMLPDIAKK